MNIAASAAASQFPFAIELRTDFRCINRWGPFAFPFTEINSSWVNILEFCWKENRFFWFFWKCWVFFSFNNTYPSLYFLLKSFRILKNMYATEQESWLEIPHSLRRCVCFFFFSPSWYIGDNDLKHKKTTTSESHWNLSIGNRG